MGEAWRHELRPFGVDVVLVEPGAYRTAIFGRNRRVTRNAYQAGSPYAGLTGAVDTIFQRAVNRIARDPREVADRIVRILSKRRPALRYPIGPDARARLLIIRTLPFWLVEWFIARILSRAARISP
jgi:short-subunit dehydrogenase